MVGMSPIMAWLQRIFYFLLVHFIFVLYALFVFLFIHLFLTKLPIIINCIFYSDIVLIMTTAFHTIRFLQTCISSICLIFIKFNMLCSFMKTIVIFDFLICLFVILGECIGWVIFANHMHWLHSWDSQHQIIGEDSI